MTTMTDFIVLDGVDYPLADYFMKLFATALRAEFRNIESITGTRQLIDNDTPYQLITASGGNQTVRLAPEANTNHVTVIYNNGGSNNLAIKDDSGVTTYISLTPGTWCVCYPIGGMYWRVMGSTSSVPDGSDTVKGIWEGGTAAETTAGIDATRVVTLAGLMQSIFSMRHTCQGRLTLTSGTPITTADVTAAGTLYFAPLRGNLIALYNGSTWKLYAFSELSLALSVASGTVYDVFVYDNSGTLTLELTSWSNPTTRATALTTQDGVLVKAGATTRRYLGTLYGTATNQTEDSAARRMLWNYYNRVPRFLYARDLTNSWTYTTATWRAANNNTTPGVGCVDCVIGWAEDLVSAVYTVPTSVSANADAAAGIGIDSTSANSAQVMGTGGMNASTVLEAKYRGYLAVGYHYIQSLEYSVASGTRTWYGDGGVTYIQSGLLVDSFS